MPRLTKIYTRTGDDGSTALGSRSRVSKNSLRVQAYGDSDELSTHIGMAISQQLDPVIEASLIRIQHEILVLGAELAFPPGESEFKIPTIEERHIRGLENDIDQINEGLGPLENFILPGGTPGAAALQIARTVCRRAERSIVALAVGESVRPEAMAYINRLSDLLFVMGRYENKAKQGREIIWDSHI